MEKVKNVIATCAGGMACFAVLGGFCDALTSNEASGIMAGVLVVLAGLSKLPTRKSNH